MKTTICLIMAIISLPVAVVGFIFEFFVQGFRDGRRIERQVERWVGDLLDDDIL